jgi:hypothetical protein
MYTRIFSQFAEECFVRGNWGRHDGLDTAGIGDEHPTHPRVVMVVGT